MRVVKFLILKVLELGLIFGVIPFIGTLTTEKQESYWGYLLTGLFSILVSIVGIAIVLIIVYALLKWINLNWKIVNKGEGIYWIETL